MPKMICIGVLNLKREMLRQLGRRRRGCKSELVRLPALLLTLPRAIEGLPCAAQVGVRNF